MTTWKEAEALMVAANLAIATLEGNAPTQFENEKLRRAYCGLSYLLQTVALFAAQVQEMEEKKYEDVPPQSEEVAIAILAACENAYASTIFEIHKKLGDDWQLAFSRTIAWLNRTQ